MSALPSQALVAPNIFDAYANPNLLLYLVASNLLSPATWDLSAKIQRRARDGSGGELPSPRRLVAEIQTVIDRNFRHLHAAEVVDVYGELDLTAERERLGRDVVDAALRQVVQTFEDRIEAGDVPRDGLQPTIDRIKEGYFPSYVYGNIDLVRASKKLTGRAHASVRGLTSCVDETAIFSSLAMTMPKGTIANVVALTSPSHSSAFGWDADGEPWWFYGKNRLYFAEDWRQHVSDRHAGNPQAAFDRIFSDVAGVLSVAGRFDFLTGESNLPEAHVAEIAAKMDAFFGIRLEQLSAGLSKLRRGGDEDPIAPCLRDLLGTPTLERARDILKTSPDAVRQDVLLTFRSLSAADLRPFLAVARQQPMSRATAEKLSHLEDVLAVVGQIAETPDIISGPDRILMPDETLRFKSGSMTDKALLLHVLVEHLYEKLGTPVPVRTLVGEARSFVKIGEKFYDAGNCREVACPSGGIRFELGE